MKYQINIVNIEKQRTKRFMNSIVIGLTEAEREEYLLGVISIANELGNNKLVSIIKNKEDEE